MAPGKDKGLPGSPPQGGLRDWARENGHWRTGARPAAGHPRTEKEKDCPCHGFGAKCGRADRDTAAPNMINATHLEEGDKRFLLSLARETLRRLLTSEPPLTSLQVPMPR